MLKLFFRLVSCALALALVNADLVQAYPLAPEGRGLFERLVPASSPSDTFQSEALAGRLSAGYSGPVAIFIWKQGGDLAKAAFLAVSPRFHWKWSVAAGILSTYIFPRLSTLAPEFLRAGISLSPGSVLSTAGILFVLIIYVVLFTGRRPMPGRRKSFVGIAALLTTTVAWAQGKKPKLHVVLPEEEAALVARQNEVLANLEGVYHNENRSDNINNVGDVSRAVINSNRRVSKAFLKWRGALQRLVSSDIPMIRKTFRLDPKSAPDYSVRGTRFNDIVGYLDSEMDPHLQNVERLRDGQGFWGKTFAFILGGVRWYSDSIVQKNMQEVYIAAIEGRIAHAEFQTVSDEEVIEAQRLWWELAIQDHLIEQKDLEIAWALRRYDRKVASDALAGGSTVDQNKLQSAYQNLRGEREILLSQKQEIERELQYRKAWDNSGMNRGVNPLRPRLEANREMLAITRRVPRSDDASVAVPEPPEWNDTVKNGVKSRGLKAELIARLKSQNVPQEIINQVDRFNDLLNPQAYAYFWGRLMPVNKDHSSIERPHPGGDVRIIQAKNLQNILMLRPQDLKPALAASPRKQGLLFQKEQLEKKKKKLDFEKQTTKTVGIHFNVREDLIFAAVPSFGISIPTEQGKKKIDLAKTAIDLKIKEINQEIAADEIDVQKRYDAALLRWKKAATQARVARDKIAIAMTNLKFELHKEGGVEADYLPQMLAVRTETLTWERWILAASGARMEMTAYLPAGRKQLQDDAVAQVEDVMKRVDQELRKADGKVSVAPSAPAAPKVNLLHWLLENPFIRKRTPAVTDDRSSIYPKAPRLVASAA